jgi:hypothetical protein
MKKIFPILFILLLSVQLFAQDKSETIKNENKYGAFDLSLINDGSVMFGYMKDPKIKTYELRQYDKNFNQVNKYELKDQPLMSPKHFVASPGNEYIYYLKYSTIPETDICQIKQGSEPVSFELEGIKKLKLITAVFAGKSYLYYFSQEGKGGKLYAVDHITRKAKTLSPQLSEQEPTRECSGWRYAGHDNNTIYLCSKTVDFKKNTYYYKIAILDTEGVVKKEFELNATPKDCLYPSRFLNNYANGDRGEPDDIYQEMSGASTRTYATIHTYTGITIDTANKFVYITGAQGKCVGYMQDAPAGLSLKFGLPHWIMPRLGGSASGLFVHKFDFDGKKVWENNVEYPTEFVSKMSSALPTSRVLSARLTSDSKNIEVAHATCTSLYGHERMVARTTLSSEGELKDKSQIKYTGLYPLGITDPNALFDCTETIIKTNHLEGLKAIDGFEVINTGAGRVAAYFIKKELEIKLQFFNN